MIIHVIVDIPQETRGDDAHPPKRNADQVHVLVARRVRRLPGRDHHLVGGFVVPDARDRFQLREHRPSGQVDGFLDEFGIGHPKPPGHRATDVFNRVGAEFVREDGVINRITDTAADHPDGQGEGGNGRDEVLLKP